MNAEEENFESIPSEDEDKDTGVPILGTLLSGITGN